RFDVSVVLPSASPESLRPDWLALGGARRPVSVDMTPCIQHLPCLIAARHPDEGSDAIPADQFVMLAPGEAGTPLYLAPGDYRLQLLGNDDRTLAEHELVVHSTPGEVPSTKDTR